MGRLISLAKVQAEDMVGSKAASLGRMLRAGFPVPNGFVIAATKPELTILGRAISKACEELGATRVAVRSSAINEDGLDASWAGQLDTFLNVSKDTVLECAARCIASTGSIRARAYATHKGTQAGDVAIIVQAMVPGDVSGVCFSIHPVTQDVDQLVIEAAYGLGEAVVSGAVIPDNYVVLRQNHRIMSRSVATQQKALLFSEQHNSTIWSDTAYPSGQKLSDKHIFELTGIVEKLEDYFGHPVDVEWSLYKDELYILQSRPITTLTHN